LRNEKGAVWGLGIKVFPYPNGFNAIRVALAIFYQIPEDELESEGEENESQDDLADLADLPDDI